MPRLSLGSGAAQILRTSQRLSIRNVGCHPFYRTSVFYNWIKNWLLSVNLPGDQLVWGSAHMTKRPSPYGSCENGHNFLDEEWKMTKIVRSPQKTKGLRKNSGNKEKKLKLSPSISSLCARFEISWPNTNLRSHTKQIHSQRGWRIASPGRAEKSNNCVFKISDISETPRRKSIKQTRTIFFSSAENRLRCVQSVIVTTIRKFCDFPLEPRCSVCQWKGCSGGKLDHVSSSCWHFVSDATRPSLSYFHEPWEKKGCARTCLFRTRGWGHTRRCSRSSPPCCRPPILTGGKRLLPNALTLLHLCTTASLRSSMGKNGSRIISSVQGTWSSQAKKVHDSGVG